jgi:hypothetical protein
MYIHIYTYIYVCAYMDLAELVNFIHELIGSGVLFIRKKEEGRNSR